MRMLISADVSPKIVSDNMNNVIYQIQITVLLLYGQNILVINMEIFVRNTQTGEDEISMHCIILPFMSKCSIVSTYQIKNNALLFSCHCIL